MSWAKKINHNNTSWPDPLPEPLEYFLKYWNALEKGPHNIPRKSDIHPRDLAAYLSRIMLIERVNDNGTIRYRYRLAGSDALTIAGQSITGAYIDELYEKETADIAHANFEDIFRTKEPHYAERSNPTPDKHFIHYQRILAPLLDKNDAPTLLIGLWLWEWV